MWIFIDLALVAIILVFALISAKKGFVKTFIELVGFFLAIYLSFTLSGVVAEGIYNSTIEPSVTKTVSETLENAVGEKTDNIVDDIWENLPSVISNSAEAFGVTKETIKGTTGDKITEANTDQIVLNVSKDVVKPIVVPIVKTILSVILFGVLMIFVRILAKILGKMFNLPIIGGINKLLGGVLGAAKGLIICFVICLLINLIVSFNANGFLIFTEENLNNTVLFKGLLSLSPFGK